MYRIMKLQNNVPLSDHSAMRLGGNAAFFTESTSSEELIEAMKWAKQNSYPMVMIGCGTNIVWQDTGYQGLVIVNKIMGFELDENVGDVTLKIGAGENWDSVVRRSVENGLSGIEALSAIPGTAGATPVQNVGAYGLEIADVLVELQAYDQETEQLLTLSNDECNFGYRTSRFNSDDKGRFFITSITLKLSKKNPQPPFYKSLQEYLEEHHITEFTPQTIRNAVIAIRSVKLPDTSTVATNGSFFANPIIDKGKFEQLQAQNPEIPNWPEAEKIKISAAWLMEQAGFPKGHHDTETGMSTWKYQALVLVNEHAKSTADLLKFKQKIVDAVKNKFDITLEQEPELI